MSFNNSVYSTGNSMSIRAEKAYDEGKMPYSKWRKKDLLWDAEGYLSEVKGGDKILAALKKAPTEVLKGLLLEGGFEWHHTSVWANQTNFYSVGEERTKGLTLEKIAEAVKEHREHKAKESAAKEKRELVKFKYLRWTGGPFSRRKSCEEVTTYGVQQGNCIFFADEDGNLTGGKKFVWANGLEIIEKIKDL